MSSADSSMEINGEKQQHTLTVDDGGETDINTLKTTSQKIPQQQEHAAKHTSTTISDLPSPAPSAPVQLSHHRARLLRQQLPGNRQETSPVRQQQDQREDRRSKHSDRQSYGHPKTNANYTYLDSSFRSFASASASGEESFASETYLAVDRADLAATATSTAVSGSTQQFHQPQSPDVKIKGTVRSRGIKGWYADAGDDGEPLHSPNVYLVASKHSVGSERSRIQQSKTGGKNDKTINVNDSSQKEYQNEDGSHNGRNYNDESAADDDDVRNNIDKFYTHNTDDFQGDDADHNDDSSYAGNESKLWRARLFVGRLVNHEYVQITIIILIMLNAIMMGMGTMDFVTENPFVEHVFTQIDRGFLVIFTLEVAMQLFYLGAALFQDAWLIFDLVIVILSWSFESLQIVRAFRIFRAFRLVTRVKPLRDLVLAVGAVLPRMYAIAALLLIIFYVFAVLFTELFSELIYEHDVNYFKTLDASLFTCMEMMTLEWAGIARETIDQVSWAWAPFTAFIAISGFIVYNLIVAVVVEAVAVTEQQVRVMDGLQSDSPAVQLEEAQERIDLLRVHLDDMVRTQTQVQQMIERMASELLYLETERMKAEERESLLRNEMDRRAEYQRSMESNRQIAPLERNYLIERERRGVNRHSRAQGSDEMALSSHSVRSLRSVSSTGNLMNETNLSRSLHGDGSLRQRRYRRRGSSAQSVPGTPKQQQAHRLNTPRSNRSLMSKST
eukprot:CAMPEP_0113513088 /NCGR_PEP_ID=MMETSP0014_2-20120614/39673_1 /TAXON_ID=2857 /ORGANISM="Nitzschia sp." /LENGTH=727 /DNA_ID=CAMNT_0000409463 /DNA_START=421 /DNA_END=2600 /DNA_ORIENTATION=- /assembly_acc=CAM_ASM_000159